MNNDFEEVENTDLIDVSDIEPNFDDNFEVTNKSENLRPISDISQSKEVASPLVASIKDRFAAFTIDAVLLYMLYWLILPVYRSIALDSAAGSIPVRGLNGIIFHGIFVLIAILWFVIPEVVFGGSVGKMLCHLTLRSTSGDYASFTSILIRTLLLPIDLLLFPLVILPAMMELTAWHQRLGDLVSRTIVLKNLSSPPRQYALSLDIIASAFARLIAFIIDFLLLAIFVLGILLLLTPEAPLASMLLIITLPVAILMFFCLPEWLAKTSPGKWILGLTVSLEDGSMIDLSTALIRSLWRVLDTNPIGFLTCLFSARHQRPGDAAAGTVVIRAPRDLKGLASLISVAAIAIATLYAGTQNRDNFLRGAFKINFLPSAEIRGKSSDNVLASDGLTLKNIQFAAGDSNTVRRPSIYGPGEKLFFLFDVDGYKRDKSKIWLQEDLIVRYPDDLVALKLENVNEMNREITREGFANFENNFMIPPNAKPGRYTLTVTVRDKLAGQEVKEQRFFYVTTPEPQAVESLPPVPPPAAPAGSALSPPSPENQQK